MMTSIMIHTTEKSQSFQCYMVFRFYNIFMLKVLYVLQLNSGTPAS